MAGGYMQMAARWLRCDTKSQAKALYGRLKAEIREGKFFPEKFRQTQDITLRTWMSRYLEVCTNRGIDNERRYGRRWSLLLGKRSLAQLTTEDLRRVQSKMLGAMCRTKGGEQSRRWSNGTINRHFAFIRHVLMLAMKDGKIDRNPACGIKFLPEEKRTRYLSQQELERLERSLPVQDWRLVAFAIETCLRREEQFQLRWDQVDLEAGQLTIPLPKGGRTRHVPLSEAAKAILRALDSFAHSPWVFPSPQNPLKHGNAQSFVNHVFTPALKRLGLQGVCWHTLRHTAALRRVMAGVDLVAVQKILGHRDIQTTLRYAHLAPGHLQDAVNRGSLSLTVTKTVTGPIGEKSEQVERTAEVVETLRGKGWLGD